MATRGAPDETGRQRDRLIRSGGPGRAATLRGVPLLFGHKRLVRAPVDVPANAQLSEVDAVAQKRSDAGWGHAQVEGEAADRLAGAAAQERLAGVFGALVRRELARPRVSSVTTRSLWMLPNAGGGCPFAEPLEPLGVLLELTLVVGGQDRANVAAARCGRVNAFANDDDPAAGRLDAVPDLELLADAAAEPGKVGDDYAAVLPALDAFDGLAERGPFL